MEYLTDISSSQTDLISYYLASKYPLAKATDFLNKEIATSQNIKNTTHRKKVIKGLKMIQTEIKNLKQNDNGFAIFVGQSV